MENFQDGHHGYHLGYHNKMISNSESPCHPDDSHEVLAQTDLPFRSRCGLKIFKMAPVAAILDIGTE